MPGSNAFLPGETPTGQPDGESAEAIVPSSESRGLETARVNEETGRLTVGKGRTGRWASDHGKDIETDDTRMGEVPDECLFDGKHGVLGV